MSEKERLTAEMKALLRNGDLKAAGEVAQKLRRDDPQESNAHSHVPPVRNSISPALIRSAELQQLRERRRRGEGAELDEFE